MLHRARAKFRLMQRLGIDTMLVCSNVATATVDDDEVSASQLRRLGDEAAAHGVRLAYEALAWGRFVDDYRRAWRIVELADHPAVGVCLDSFHILSRGHDPAAIEQIPGEKIFFLQLADAPALTMDVLSWSRHHRLFPGEGAFDLAAFVGHCLEAGYTGPMSLEVFNDTFRQTDVAAHRPAGQAVADLAGGPGGAPAPAAAGPTGPYALPEVDQPAAFDFVEVKAEDAGDVDVLLRQLGFTFRGRHRSKPVRLWTQGRARVVCNEQQARDLVPTLAAVGFEVADPATSAERARALDAPAVFRRTDAPDVDLPAFRAPDGTEVFLASAADGDAAWVAEFEGGEEVGGDAAAHRDRPRQPRPAVAERSTRRCCSTAACSPWSPAAARTLPAPTGLVRSQVVRTRDGAVRLALNVAPLASEHPSGFPQHVAFASGDALAAARAARAARAPPAADPGQLLRRPGRPLRPRRRAWSRRCRSSACSTTGTRTATSRTSTPRPSAACSSRSCSAAVAIRATGRRMPRCGSRPSTCAVRSRSAARRSSPRARWRRPRWS